MYYRKCANTPRGIYPVLSELSYYLDQINNDALIVVILYLCFEVGPGVAGLGELVTVGDPVGPVAHLPVQVKEEARRAAHRRQCMPAHKVIRHTAHHVSEAQR
jgi:hypothetical protein